MDKPVGVVLGVDVGEDLLCMENEKTSRGSQGKVIISAGRMLIVTTLQTLQALLNNVAPLGFA